MLNSLRANSPFGRVARSYESARGDLAVPSRVPSRLASPSITGELARRLRVELRCSESVQGLTSTEH